MHETSERCFIWLQSVREIWQEISVCLMVVVGFFSARSHKRNTITPRLVEPTRSPFASFSQIGCSCDWPAAVAHSNTGTYLRCLLKGHCIRTEHTFRNRVRFPPIYFHLKERQPETRTQAFLRTHQHVWTQAVNHLTCAAQTCLFWETVCHNTRLWFTSVIYAIV